MRRPDPSGPLMAGHSVAILAGYALGALTAEMTVWLRRDLMWRLRRAFLRREVERLESPDVLA